MEFLILFFLPFPQMLVQTKFGKDWHSSSWEENANLSDSDVLSKRNRVNLFYLVWLLHLAGYQMNWIWYLAPSVAVLSADWILYKTAITCEFFFTKIYNHSLYFRKDESFLHLYNRKLNMTLFCTHNFCILKEYICSDELVNHEKMVI